MREARIWGRLLGLDRAVVERVEHGPDGRVVVHARPVARQRGRCGRCGRRSPGYDQGGRRRWRALDLGTVQAFVEADTPRVRCRVHGVTVVRVPWARHGAGHTRAFDDQVAWLVTTSSQVAVTRLMRIAWRTVGAIVTRVMAEVDARVDRLEGLRRIGIDEVHYRRGHKYLVVVTDHDTGRLVWAAPGRDGTVLRGFFDALGVERSHALTHITADGAPWIADAVAERAPQAVLCADPFHIVSWAQGTLDELRRKAWNTARGKLGGSRPGQRSGRTVTLSAGQAKTWKNARWALWKNPDTLTANQQSTLDWIAVNDPRLHKAYLIKEGLRYVFTLRGQDALDALAKWRASAWRSRIPEIVKLQRRIANHLTTITATLTHGLTNALTESTNTKIRLITRRAFGFHTPHALIAQALLTLGGYTPTLPGR
jgi:transposase